VCGLLFVVAVCNDALSVLELEVAFEEDANGVVVHETQDAVPELIFFQVATAQLPREEEVVAEPRRSRCDRFRVYMCFVDDESTVESNGTVTVFSPRILLVLHKKHLYRGYFSTPGITATPGHGYLPRIIECRSRCAGIGTLSIVEQGPSSRLLVRIVVGTRRESERRLSWTCRIQAASCDASRD